MKEDLIPVGYDEMKEQSIRRKVMEIGELQLHAARHGYYLIKNEQLIQINDNMADFVKSLNRIKEQNIIVQECLIEIILLVQSKGDADEVNVAIQKLARKGLGDSGAGV